MTGLEKMKRILVVDDESDFLETFLDFLSFEFDSSVLLVDSAMNGVEALEKMQGQNYDLLITDMRMPKMDGLELVRNVRLNKDNLTIIVFSGHAGEEERGQLKCFGVEKLVKKPHLPELVTCLKDSLNIKAV